ncbi:MAG: hypothetical protein JW956_01700 [Calditrichaceae bacterium]|nr:hypothetical protein [Calditrichaceae bacterium]
MRTLILLLFLTASIFAQEIIDISVKGISNPKNDGAQQDRLEAIMDAKRQACEKAGMTIESKTKVENFEIAYDYIETQAETVLLPGFQLIEIGYVQDGTFQVVLTGKIKVLEGEEPISNKELRYAQSLRERGKHAECEQILKKYIDGQNKEASEELKEEALYCFIKWGYAWDTPESVQKFAAYYPDSKYLPALESFADFSANTLYQLNKTYQSSAKDWQPAELKHNDITYTKKITAASDTIIFKNFRDKDQTLLFNFCLFSTDGEEAKTAYKIKLSYFDGNFKESPATDQLKEVEDRFRTFQPGGSPTFQHSASGGGFSDFRMKGYMIKGQVPVGEGLFEQTVQFEIFQKSF